MAKKNLFCKDSQLTNEASVENWFVDKLLEFLGFAPDDILLKTSIAETKIGKGSQSCLYKPDYIIKSRAFPTVVIDAKAPMEGLNKWVSQCSSYCLELNRLFEHNPVEYFIITNGNETRLYKWDQGEPLLTLTFGDFALDNTKFVRLQALLSPSSLASVQRKKRNELLESEFQFKPVSLDRISSIFANLHQYIWENEKKTPSGAFLELIKVIFVKIKKDRELRIKIGEGNMPKVKDVVFSSAWIQSQTEHDNPVNDPLFRNLLRDLEIEIRDKEKRRIFGKHDEISLSPATILKIVKEIEHIDFDAMDEDIHGRMFESFLDATTRGPELGQFFTPRDIVSLVVRLADIKVSKTGVESVLDACCGSGGFLIGALWDMMSKSKRLTGMSAMERQKLQHLIANCSLTGIDAGSEPPIYRIARMNMYLHGDGGTNIYFADSLDKNIGLVGRGDLELDEEIAHLRKMLIVDGKRFDVVLSNPPFSMKYARESAEQREILNQYDLAGQARETTSMLSSVMFLERYLELVKEGGRILRIIDDSVLSGESYFKIRQFIREKFIIRGIISLPGDAFKRADARVKTSLIILTPKGEGDEQGDIFMEKSIYLGLLAKTAKRIGITEDELDRERPLEIERIITSYRAFETGEAGPYVVSPDRIQDRLDVKHCLGETGRLIPMWKRKGAKIGTLSSVLKLCKGRRTDVLESEEYTLLKVTYDGKVVEAETKFGDDCSYRTLYRVAAWDILFSNMGIGRGAIGLVPSYLAGCFVSNEYTLLRADSDIESFYYCGILRTKEILGDILSSTTGMNRGRIRWEDMQRINVPLPAGNGDALSLAVAALKRLWKAQEELAETSAKCLDSVATKLRLEAPESRLRWLAYKPPE